MLPAPLARVSALVASAPVPTPLLAARRELHLDRSRGGVSTAVGTAVNTGADSEHVRGPRLRVPCVHDSTLGVLPPVSRSQAPLITPRPNGQHLFNGRDTVSTFTHGRNAASTFRNNVSPPDSLFVITTRFSNWSASSSQTGQHRHRQPVSIFIADQSASSSPTGQHLHRQPVSIVIVNQSASSSSTSQHLHRQQVRQLASNFTSLIKRQKTKKK
jgi:hypothetical protein